MLESPKEQIETEILTVAELAARLKISRNSAYKLCQEAGFPAVRVGGSIRIPVRLLDEWMGDGAKRL